MESGSERQNVTGISFVPKGFSEDYKALEARASAETATADTKNLYANVCAALSADTPHVAAQLMGYQPEDYALTLENLSTVAKARVGMLPIETQRAVFTALNQGSFDSIRQQLKLRPNDKLFA